MNGTGWFQRVDSRLWVPAVGSVAGNAIPLVAVLWWGANLYTILGVYWLETAVVGVVTAAKIHRAEGDDDPDRIPGWTYISFGESRKKTIRSLVGKPKRAVLWQFLETYFVTWLLLGIYLRALGLGLLSGTPPLTAASPGIVVVSTVGITAYHAISYRRDFITGREYERKGPVTVVVDPFQRVLVLYVTVVLGGSAAEYVGPSVGFVMVLITVKTYFDLHAHWREHR